MSGLRSRAELGNPQAQFLLGNLYRDGQGVERNIAKTLKWWSWAALQGHRDAQFALGNIYSGGTGAPRDMVQAYMWYDIVGARGPEDWVGPIAASNRDALIAHMTPSQIAEAKRRAAAWLANASK